MKKLALLALVGFAAWKYYGNRPGLVVFFPDETSAFFPHWNDSELDLALRTPGARVFAFIDGQVGHEYSPRQFQGGWLVDGCPLQVLWGEGWLPGQVEALQTAGIRPNCPVLYEHVA